MLHDRRKKENYHNKLLRKEKENMVKEVYGNLLKQPNVDIIAHFASVRGDMNDGIALEIKKCLLSNNEYNRYVTECRQKGTENYGQTFMLEAPDGRLVANCFAKIGKSGDVNKDYADLLHSVAKVANYAKLSNMTVGVPGLMGCGKEGGKWPTVRDMLYKLFNKKGVPHLLICYVDEKEYRKWNP